MAESLLRSETLAAMRETTARARPDTALIKRAPTDRTIEGFDPRQATAFHTTTCLIVPPRRGTVDSPDGRQVVVTPLQIALPYDADIQVRDYVMVGARLFRVTSLVNGSTGWEAQRLVECEEIL